MNTNMAAKELGVSAKTVQRWVKQLNLPAERNELGHYSFTSEDLDVLKSVKQQISEGTALLDVQVPRLTEKTDGLYFAALENQWRHRTKAGGAGAQTGCSHERETGREPSAFKNRRAGTPAETKSG